MPRKLVVTVYSSLDGVIQDPVGMENSGLGDWTGPFKRGPEGDRFKHQELLDSGALLLGRTTYDGFAAVWPLVKDETGFANRMNQLPKYVVSTTLRVADWNGTSIIAGNMVDSVMALKAADGGDLLVYGSAALVHSMMPHDLVDEYRLMVYPVILGHGTRLFPEGVSARLKLLEQRCFGDGIVLLRYTPDRPDAMALA